MYKILFVTIAALLVLLGCTEEDNPARVPPITGLSIELRAEDWKVKAFEGMESDLSFIAIVRNINGVAEEGVEVTMSLKGAEGIVSPAEASTDNNGMIEATAKIKVTLGESTAQLLVNAGGSTRTQVIEVKGLKIPTRLHLTTETPEVSVVPDQNAEIKLSAIALDEDRVVIPGVDLKFNLLPCPPDSQIFGYLSQAEPTDDEGRTRVIFSSLGETGELIIRCEVEGLTEVDTSLYSEIELKITSLHHLINTLHVKVEPRSLFLSLDSIGKAKVTAWVIDENGKGIPNLRIDFSCLFGRFGIATLTDSLGIAMSEYWIIPSLDFPDPEVPAIEDQIRAFIPFTIFNSSTVIYVEKINDDPEYSIDLYSDVDFIFADNGLTVANITAVLKDYNYQAVAGEMVIFTATYGTVNSPVITDSMGIARAVFRDLGRPSIEGGEIVPAVITALSSQRKWWSASIEIVIEERISVDCISLQAEKTQLTVGDSTLVWVTCFLANGSFAPEGTKVYLECNKGFFRSNPDTINGNNGMAGTYWFPDSTIGIASLRAYVMNGDSAVYSNTVEIEIIPGPPTSITVIAEPDTIRVGTGSSTITATVMDALGNRAGDGILVTFSSTLGTFNRNSRSTDENGQATVELYTGDESGVSVVTAATGEIIGTTTVVILAGGGSIELDADPTNIPVEDGQSTISARLYDSQRNPVETLEWITFEILNEASPFGGGCYFDNGEQIDSAQTVDGRAEVILNAGLQIGPKLLKASAVFGEDRSDNVETILSRVSVVAGPPDRIDVDVDNRGIDLGGGAWQIEVSARVYDLYMNPVADSIAVSFSTDSIASISGGWTGNQNRYGVSVPGVAFAPLVYNSIHTYDTLTIRAEVQTPERTINAERVSFLPLQQGILTLDVSPGSWMIDEGPDSCNFTCLAELRDGHGVPINNAPIIFASSRGKFFWFNYYRNRYYMYDYLSYEIPRKHTGWNLPDHPEHRENPGQATVYLQGNEETFFWNSNAAEIAVRIEARVEGNDVEADPVVVFVTRHQ